MMASKSSDDMNTRPGSILQNFITRAQENNRLIESIQEEDQAMGKLGVAVGEDSIAESTDHAAFLRQGDLVELLYDFF